MMTRLKIALAGATLALGFSTLADPADAAGAAGIARTLTTDVSAGTVEPVYYRYRRHYYAPRYYYRPYRYYGYRRW